MPETSDKVALELISGPAGNALYLDNHRVAGPKPWGGGRTIWQGSAKRSEVMIALGIPAPPRAEDDR